MAYNVLPVAIAGGGGLIQAAIAITGFAAGPGANTGTITGVGLGVNAVRGDAAQVAGSTSNDGVYIVVDQIDANNIEVYPAPVVEAAAGTCEIREQNHRLDIVDEHAAGVTAALIAAAMVAGHDARLFQRVAFAPAQTVAREWSFYGFLFRQIVVSHTGANNTVFTSTRETWFVAWERASATTIASAWSAQIAAADPGTLETNVGALANAADPRSGIDPSHFIGGSWLGQAIRHQTRYNCGMFSSTSAATLMNIDDGQGTGRLSCFLADGGVAAPITAGSVDQVNNLILSSPTFGFTPVGTLSNADNILVAQSLQFGVVFAAATEVPIGPGLELSDAAFSPGNTLIFGSAAVVPSPNEDYSEAELFNLSSATGRKTFRFDPRFVERNANTGPQPISGAIVSIFRVSDGHYVQVANQTDGTYTIRINGEDHTHVSAGQSAAQLRNSLVTAINAGSQPVTANSGINGNQVGGTGLIINADVDDTPFSISIEAEPTPGDLVLDPVPAAGAALVALANDGDYREQEVVGSPFTTDASGRIDTDGVDLQAFIGHENGIGTRFIHSFYNVRVSHPIFGPLVFNFKPTADFEAQIAVPVGRVEGTLQI